MAEAKTDKVRRLMAPPTPEGAIKLYGGDHRQEGNARGEGPRRGQVQGQDGWRALKINSRRPHDSVVYLAASCAGAHPTRPLPAIVKTIERRRGMGAAMTNDFDYEAMIASFMALAMAAVCWGVLIAPLAG